MGSVVVGRSDLVVWTQVRRHICVLRQPSRQEPENEPTFPPSWRKQCGRGPAGAEDFSQRRMAEWEWADRRNKQSNHIKRQRVWSDEVRRQGQIPKTQTAVVWRRTHINIRMYDQEKRSLLMYKERMTNRCFNHYSHFNILQSDLKSEKGGISPV